MTTTARNWNEASVTNATAANTIDTEINNVRIDVRERMAIDHEWDTSDSGASDIAEIGQHTKITFAAPIASPTEDTDLGYLYTKDVVTGTSTTAEAHWLDENGNELQMTVEGKFNVGSNLVADSIDQDDIRLENDSYLTGRNNADDGDVNVVKVNTSDTLTFGAVCTLPDTSALATSGAPTADAQIANKKYVDDNVGAANYTPTSYAGEESVTFPNGLIMKFGQDDEGAVSFDAAFPNACLGVQLTSTDGSSSYEAGATSVTASGFTITHNGAGTKNCYWTAIGY